MLKISFLAVLISAVLLCLLYFLLCKKRGYACEDLTSAYKIKLKRNGQRHTRNNLFYKTINALAAWAFFAGYFLNDTVLANDSYINKYQNDHYFKYDINLYSPKDVSLPSDCPPKLDINQAYPKNKLLAVTDCIPGNPGSSPTPRPPSAPSQCGPSQCGPSQCGPSQCGPSQCGPSQCGPSPCGPSKCGPSPCGPSKCAGSGGNTVSVCGGSGGNTVSVCGSWYQLHDPGLSDCTNFNQGINPSTGVCIYEGECYGGTQGTGNSANNPGIPGGGAPSWNCSTTANCAICMNWP